MICPVPSCTGPDRRPVCKHRMGVKESHFLHGLECVISSCFLIYTTGTILFIDHTGAYNAKLINVKNPLVLLYKRFSRSVKNSYFLHFVTFYLCPINSTAAFSSELFALLSDLREKKKMITTNDCIKSNV